MIDPNPNLLCKEAKLFYYDFLCGESQESIPASVINHIKRCSSCQERVNQLQAALSRTEEHIESEQQADSAITTMLKLHFACIGKPVTCNIVKPFLPCLLDPALEIRIPTPIITHLHNCRQCSEELDMIRCLNLNRRQLCRLSQLFAEKPMGDNIDCSKARNAIPSVVSMVFSEHDSEVLKHLCICTVCRELLYKERQKIYESLPEKAPSPEFPCESVSTADIFDFVVPYGIGPASDRYAKSYKSLISHLMNCRRCLYKMQHLHQTIFNIVERPDSDVVTVYYIDESAEAEVRSEFDDIYAGFPIRVETASPAGRVNAGWSASTIAFGAFLKRKVSAVKLKPLAKAAVAAAAVVLIAVALFLSTQPARAITIEQVYKALEKVKNVHISSFVPDNTEPIQEKWVSRALNIYMTKTGEQLVLSDIPSGVIKSKYLGAAVTETRPLTYDDLADVEEKMTGSLGLIPLSDISDVLPDSEWGRVAHDGLADVSEDFEVYDLLWTEQGPSGPPIFKKCRLFIDPYTNLPHKIKIYRKIAADSPDILRSKVLVEYLSDSEIRTIIEDAGF